MPNIPSNVQVRDLSTFAGRIGAAMDVLLGRDFNPGVPLSPRTEPNSQEQTQGPRQFQYPVAVNTFPAPRREYTGLTPFDQLRNLAALYDVAAMCVAARIEEMQGMAWSIAAKDKKMQAQLQGECDEMTHFFEQPDKLTDFSSWIGSLLYDLYVIDATTIYKRLDESGDLYALELVDGATIKPLLDDRGRTLAYQQVLYGYPFSEYRRPDTEAPDEQMPVFGTNELIYKPRWPRTVTPYGFPPTEWIIMRVNMALRKQSWDMAWFTDGNVPDGYASPPDGANLNPQQVREFEDWFNAALAGSDTARRRVRFFPWAMNYQPFREFTYETTLDEWMLRVTCAAYSLPPQELGFTSDVNKATAEMQEAVNERRGMKPLSVWLKDVIFDPLIRHGFKRVNETSSLSLPGLPTKPVVSPFSLIEWQWHFGDKADMLVQAQSDQIYLSTGVISPDEVRVMRFGDTLDGAAPGPQMPQLPFPQMQQPPQPLTNAAQADMKLWQNKAIKAMKMGRPANVPFVSVHIPPDVMRKVQVGLQEVNNASDLQRVFGFDAPEVAPEDHPFRWSEYG